MNHVPAPPFTSLARLCSGRSYFSVSLLDFSIFRGCRMFCFPVCLLLICCSNCFLFSACLGPWELGLSLLLLLLYTLFSMWLSFDIHSVRLCLLYHALLVLFALHQPHLPSDHLSVMCYLLIGGLLFWFDCYRPVPYSAPCINLIMAWVSSASGFGILQHYMVLYLFCCRLFPFFCFFALPFFIAC